MEVYINQVCTLELHNGFRKICLAVAVFSVLYTFPPPAKQSLKEAANSVALLHTHAAALQSLYKKLSLSFISNDEMKCSHTCILLVLPSNSSFVAMLFTSQHYWSDEKMASRCSQVQWHAILSENMVPFLYHEIKGFCPWLS